MSSGAAKPHVPFAIPSKNVRVSDQLTGIDGMRSGQEGQEGHEKTKPSRTQYVRLDRALVSPPYSELS